MWAKFDEIKDVRFFKEIMNTNYMGSVYCVHYALPFLKRSKGKIISCSTGQAIMGFPNHSGYVASKHALHGFLSTIRMENKADITVLEAVLSWIKGTSLRDNSFGTNGEKKQGINSKYSMFNSIILDPELTKSVEKDISFYSAMDCYIHSVESITGTMITPLSMFYAREALSICQERFLNNDKNNSRFVFVSNFSIFPTTNVCW